MLLSLEGGPEQSLQVFLAIFTYTYTSFAILCYHYISLVFDNCRKIKNKANFMSQFVRIHDYS